MNKKEMDNKMENKSSITSLMSSFGRAYHSEHEEQPIFNDIKAKELMTAEEYKTIGGYILGGIDFFTPEKKGTFANDSEALLYLVNTQIAPTPLARAAYCEEMIKNALLTGTEQIVILGAGMDTFAFRNEDVNCKIFEVDHPLTQADKIERIKRAGWQIPENLTFVPLDFAKDNLKEHLVSNGFDTGKKTFFSWLGVSYYLSVEQIEAMLKSVAELSADGSTLLFDYGDEALFTTETKRVKNMLAMAGAGGEPMKSCFSEEELTATLEKHSMLIYELLTSEDIDKKYFNGRSYHAFENINYCLAVVK